MDSMCFEMKRSHWRGVWLTNFYLQKRGGVPLTAARFDLMHTIVMFPDRRAPTQEALRRMLGVASSTVSRMLDALEELGFVTREPAEGDGRANCVRVTEEGMSVLQDGAWWTLHDPTVQHRVDLAIAEPHLGREDAQRKREELSDALTRWRWVLEDGAMKPDPWSVLVARGAVDPLATPRAPRPRRGNGAPEESDPFEGFEDDVPQDSPHPTRALPRLPPALPPAALPPAAPSGPPAPPSAPPSAAPA